MTCPITDDGLLSLNNSATPKAIVSPPVDGRHGRRLDATTSRLPEDVISNVLSRLPVKPLCRFRCVSKAWRALISDPAFIAAQRSRAGPLPVLLIGVFQGYRGTLELRVMDARGSVLRVVRDVEDRKLSRARLDLVRLDGELYGAAAVDPATGRAVAIRGYVDEPASRDAVDPHTGRVFTRLGYDDGIYYSGFGRAAASGVYKAVRLINIKGRVSVRAEVATLDGGGVLTWRQGPAAPFLPCCAPWCTPTVGGVLYYLPCSAHCLDAVRNRVAAFDLESEEWKPMIEFPEGVKMQMSLVELKGTLAMVHFEGSRSWQTNIWFLVDSERSVWVKQHVIQMHRSWRVKPLEIFSDGRMLLLNLVEKQGHYAHSLRWVLQLRDPNTGVHTDLMEMPREYMNRMTLYRGSLLC